MDVQVKQEPVDEPEGMEMPEADEPAPDEPAQAPAPDSDEKGLHCAHCGFVTADYDGMMAHMTGHATLSHNDHGPADSPKTSAPAPTPSDNRSSVMMKPLPQNLVVSPTPDKLSAVSANAFTMTNRNPLPAIKDKIFQEITYGQNKSVRYFSCIKCQFWSCFCGVMRYHVDTEHHLIENRVNKYRCAVCKKEYPGLFPVLLHLNIQHGITQMNNKVLETGNRMSDAKMRAIQDYGLTCIQPNVLGVDTEDMYQCFQCKMCEKVFPSDVSCRQHLLSAHLAYVGVYTCRSCDFRCSFQADMASHLKSCHGENALSNFHCDSEKMKAAQDLTITNTDKINVSKDQLALDVELTLGEIALKIQHSVVLLPIAILNGLRSVDMTSSGDGWKALQGLQRPGAASPLKAALTMPTPITPSASPRQILAKPSTSVSPAMTAAIVEPVVKSPIVMIPSKSPDVPLVQSPTSITSAKKKRKKSLSQEEKMWEPGSVEKKPRSEATPTRYSLRESRSRINYKDILEDFDTEDDEEDMVVVRKKNEPKILTIPAQPLIPVTAVSEPDKSGSSDQPMYSVQLTPNVVMLNTLVDDDLLDDDEEQPESSGNVAQAIPNSPAATMSASMVIPSPAKPIVQQARTPPVVRQSPAPQSRPQVMTPVTQTPPQASGPSPIVTSINKNVYIEKYGERFLDFFNNRRKFKYHKKAHEEILDELLDEEFQMNRMCYMCQKCGFLTVNMDESEQHIRKLHLTHIKPMRCKGCRAEFSNAKEFLKHIRIHPNLANNKEEPLMQKGVLNLKKAANQSMEAKKNCILLNLGNCYMGPIEECARDKEKMRSAADWAIPTFECQDCKAKHLSEEIVKEHIIIKHITSEKKKHMYKCDHCPYSTTTFTFLRWHVKNHHKSVTEEIKYRDPRDLAGNYVTKVKCKDLDTLALVMQQSGTIKRLKTTDYADDSGDDDILNEFPLPDPKSISAMLPVGTVPQGAINTRPVGRPIVAKIGTPKIVLTESNHKNGASTSNINGVQQQPVVENEDKDDDLVVVSSKPSRAARQAKSMADNSRSSTPESTTGSSNSQDAAKPVKKNAIVYECEHCTFTCQSYSVFTNHKDTLHPGLDDC